MLYVPSIFTPLEETRMKDGKPLKSKELTQLQWEFIMTAWKQSRDFGEMRDRSRSYFRVGTKIFYHVRGKHVHGPAFKWPAMRFAGVPEDKLSEHLYLNWDKDPNNTATPPRLIPKHRKQTLEELRTVNDFQPFNVYGAGRDKEADAAGSASPFRILSSYGSNGDGAKTEEKVEEAVAGD